MGQSEAVGRTTFMYFGYGSNLLSKRLHIQNPSAVRRNIGVLKGYHLDFFTTYERGSGIWNGSSATIIDDADDENAVVWGAIWEINGEHLDDLDRQEGVQNNIYIPLIKEIITPNGEKIKCRVYQMVKQPTGKVDLADDALPYERRPSKTYLDTIINGAIESGLPVKYNEFLKSIQHNGKLAEPEMLEKLK